MKRRRTSRKVHLNYYIYYWHVGEGRILAHWESRSHKDLTPKRSGEGSRQLSFVNYDEYLAM